LQTPFRLNGTKAGIGRKSCFRTAPNQEGWDAMALKVELKPNERILIGESVITNCDQRSWLVIEGASPILREKDILTPSRADSPAKRIYLAVQLMYTSRDPRTHHDVYFALVRQIVQAAPSTWRFVEAINNQILTGNLYKALKEAKKLIVYEEGLLQNAKRGPGLQKRGKAHVKSAGA
jgi:flagellar protein FlbT